jgi:hypothetical protein
MNNRAPALFPEAGGSDDGWLPANTGPGCLDGDNITPGSVGIIVGGEYPKCGIVVLRRPPMYVRSWPILLKNSFGLSAGCFPLKNRAQECLQIKISVEFRKADYSRALSIFRCRVFQHNRPNQEIQ